MDVDSFADQREEGRERFVEGHAGIIARAMPTCTPSPLDRSPHRRSSEPAFGTYGWD